MSTEQRLMHAIVSDAIASCRVPVPQELSVRSEFDAGLADVLEVGLPVARERLDAVARAQRAERESDAAIEARDEARLDADMFCEQRDELRVRVQELEAEVRELRGEP